MLEDDLPDLLPVMRPYQRRAAYWMVQKEKADSKSSDKRERSRFFFPLCMPVQFLDASSKMFYNPFRYDIVNSTWVEKGQKNCKVHSLSLSHSHFYLKLCSVAMFRCTQSFLHHVSLVEFSLVSPLQYFALQMSNF